MDELDALRGMRTALAEEERPERLALRIKWHDAPRRRRRKAPMLGLSATALVAAGSVAVLTLGTGSPAPPGTEPTAVPQGNVLLVAATNAQKAPGGRYWHFKRTLGEIYTVGSRAADHYRIDSRQQAEAWVPSGEGSGKLSMVDLPDRPWSDRDRLRWQRAGSPSRIEVPSAEGPVVMFINEAPMPMNRPGDTWGKENVYGLTYKQLAQLPTDPRALKKRLLDLKGDWHVHTSSGRDEPIRSLKGAKQARALSDVAETLLSTAPVPPQVRAATFRMLAELPGVKAEGTTTDPLGRTGAAVSLPVESTVPLGLYSAPKQLGTYRRQWIIDPAKGTLMATLDLVVTPPRGSRTLPPGDDGRPRSLQVKDMPDRFHKPGEVASYAVFDTTEWTDSLPR